MTRVVVVGGGLSGLLTGCVLTLRGAEVQVADEGPEPGGILQTRRESGYRLEPAAGTLLLPHPALSPVLEAAGGKVVPSSAPPRRWVFDGHRLVELRPGPGLLLAPLASPAAKVRALLEPTRPVGPGEEETLSGFMARRFGSGVGRLAADLMAAGVFAGDPEVLSADAFPRLLAMESERGSVLRGMLEARRAAAPGSRPRSHVPVDGMAALAASLAGLLGDRLRLRFAVEGVRREGGRWRVEGTEALEADRVVLAVRPERAAALVPDPDLAALLGEATAAPVAVVFLGGESSSVPLPDGFGYLTTSDAGTLSVGGLFESAIDPDRAPPGHSLLKVMVGGGRNPAVVDWDDARLVEAVGAETARVLGRDVEASFARVARHHPGIPQYRPGYREWLRRLESRLAGLPGLHLAGWGYRGVGISQLATEAATLAELPET